MRIMAQAANDRSKLTGSERHWVYMQERKSYTATARADPLVDIGILIKKAAIEEAAEHNLEITTDQMSNLENARYHDVWMPRKRRVMCIQEPS